jgi:hypothetical protein
MEGIMKTVKLVIALIFLCMSALAAYAAEPVSNKEDINSITAVVKTHASKDAVEGVFVNKIIGDYAEATVAIKDADGFISYLKKTDKKWSILFYGNAVSEESLVKLGVPEDIAKKFSE